MDRPIVIAYHIIWTAYGWWLPNDPRGSTSRSIASDTIAALGQLHVGRKEVQPLSRDVNAFYERAKLVLKHPLLEVRDDAVPCVANAIAEVMEQQCYTCYACAIMPDHVHILLRKHKHLAEEMLDFLQDGSRCALIDAGHRPSDHPVWTGGGGWIVYLDHPDEVERTIPYIEANPVKARLPRQDWPFVTTYDRWPLHSGHSPNSPYVRRLRAAGRYP
jgi:REP element-mobilizing transposase RayT